MSNIKTHGDCWGYTPSCFAIPQEQSPAVLMTISIEANSRNLNTTETILLSLVGKCRDITERRDVVPESLSGQHAWGLLGVYTQLLCNSARAVPSRVGVKFVSLQDAVAMSAKRNCWLIQDSACAYLSGARQIGAINNLLPDWTKDECY